MRLNTEPRANVVVTPADTIVATIIITNAAWFRCSSAHMCRCRRVFGIWDGDCGALTGEAAWPQEITD
jgi:hypothetical protein